MFRKNSNIFFSKKKLKENKGVIKSHAVSNRNIIWLGAGMIQGNFDKQHVLLL